MRTILITAIGGDIAQGVATIFREARADYRLVGIDAQERHAGSLFVDALYTVPNATDKNYLSSLESIIKKESVHIVLPVSEPELSALKSIQPRLKGLQWLTCGETVVTTGLDKLETINRIKTLGIAVPWTVPVAIGLPPVYPCILKNRTGSGSRSVFTVTDKVDAQYLAKRYPEAIYQELLQPAEREVTCAVFRAKDGRVATLQMLRTLVGGLTGWAQVINDVETSVMCRSIAEGLDLRGSMNVQLRLTEKGPRIFEINPRFSSTTLMRHRLGYKDAIWALDDLEGREFHIPEIPPSGTVVRVQGAELLPLSIPRQLQ